MTVSEGPATTITSDAENRRTASPRVLARIAAHRVTIAWIALCLIALVILDRLQSPRTFFGDEWGFVFDRSGGLSSLLRPHNGHLSTLPILAYRIGFALFGLDHYRPYRIMGLLVHVAVASLVFQYVKARLGTTVGLAAGAVVLFLGSGWENIFWPFQIGFMGSAAFGIVAWLALDRTSRKADIVASVAVGAALMCSGIGIAVYAGTLAQLIVQKAWRRIVAVMAAPGILYAAWYLKYGVSQGSSDNIKRLPRFVVDAGSAAIAGLGGRDLLWGRLFFGLLIGFAMIFVIQRHALSTTIAAPAVCAVANWCLIGYSRAQLGEPGSSRYVYLGAVFVVLVVANIAQPFVRPWFPYAAIALGCLGVWGNWAVLHAGARGRLEVTAITRSELRAVEWAAPTVDAGFEADGVLLPGVTAGQYLQAVNELGSAAASDGEVAVAPNATRSEVDRVSMLALRFAPHPATAETAPAGTSTVGTGAPIDVQPGQCVRVTVGQDTAVVQVAVQAGSGGVVVGSDEAPVEVRLKRFADTYPLAPNAVVDLAETVTVTVPADTAPRSEWSVELRSPGAFELCRSPG